MALFVAIVAAIFAYFAWRAAEKDLDISRRNWSMTLRQPILEAKFEVKPPDRGYSADNLGRKYQWMYPQFYALVTNTREGTRRCDAFFIELLIPKTALSKDVQSRLLATSDEDVFHKSYVHTLPIFPGQEDLRLSFQFSLDWPTHHTEFVVRYRMKDDYNSYPPDANGWLQATVQPPIRERGEYIQPRDEAERKMLVMIQAAFTDLEKRYKAYTAAFQALDDLPALPMIERLERATSVAEQAIREQKTTV